MKKLSLFMLMAVGLLISASMSAMPAKVALTREVRPEMPQVEKQQVAKPQPFAMAQVQGSSMHKAPKKVALSTEAISDDQVLLKVGETEIGLKSIVEAFKYVNEKCTASDSATIILQKNIDLAKDDYQITGGSYYGVSLNKDRKVVLDLNGFNFTSSIKTGSGTVENNTDGKTSALIRNSGNLTIVDNTFIMPALSSYDPATADFSKSSIIFLEQTADKRPSPGFASNLVSNYGKLTIENCQLVNHSYGSAVYCVDLYPTERDVVLQVKSGLLFSSLCNAIRQAMFLGTYESEMTIDGGLLIGGGAGVWTQFGGNAQRCVANFSGGKVIAGYGSDDPSKYYSYYSYPSGNLSHVVVNISGTDFVGKVYLLGNLTKSSDGKGLTVNILGGEYNNYFLLGYNDITLNISDGVFNDEIYSYGGWSEGADNNIINISGGTFNADVYTSYSEAAKTTKGNQINITNGVFNGLVEACYSNNTHINISGGTFNNKVELYTYSDTYNSYNSSITISDGTFVKDVYDYCGNNNSIIVTGGLFARDVSLKYPSYYANDKVNPTLSIKGGYYQYDCYYTYNESLYFGQEHWHAGYSPAYYTDWRSALAEGLVREEQYNAETGKYTPYVTEGGINYYFKIGQETKPEGGFITDPEDSTTTIKVIDPITEEVRDPEPTDNIIITNDNPKGEDEYGRDTMYLDNLDVNGITFAGRDTVDVIAKLGSIVNIGSSGIKASDTTTVYITVEGGGAMKVGTEAIQEVDTVIVKSDANGNGTLLISPNAQLTEEEKFATVKLYVDGARKLDDTYYIWQHVAVPTDGKGTFTVENDRKATDPGFLTFVQYWDQTLTSEDKWHQINSWEEMNKPWQGFILTTNSTTPGVTYSFTGNIIGNNDGQLHFDAKGYNFFGNSFTAPINVQTMLNGISNGEDIEMTVWIYSADKRRYLESNNLMRLLGMPEFDQISSMQGFWLRNMTDDYELNGSVNYTNAVWNNPGAMSNPKVKAPARRQVASEMGLSTAQIIVSNDSREDKLLLVEGSEYTERFDNGSDASKMIDENAFNIYATTTAGDLACVATDELAGTMLSFKAVEAGEYTMTFANTVGKEYVIYDMMTGQTIKMTEGDSFTFVAEAGLSEGRFMINQAPGSVTEMEKVQNASAIKGVYNMLGQYVANTADWSKLSAGIYVVDGVKVIK